MGFAKFQFNIWPLNGSLYIFPKVSFKRKNIVMVKQPATKPVKELAVEAISYLSFI